MSRLDLQTVEPWPVAVPVVRRSDEDDRHWHARICRVTGEMLKKRSEELLALPLGASYQPETRH